MQIGFNVTYFMDGLKSVDSESVIIEFSEDEGQTRIFKDEGKDYLYMLMPVRLSPQDIVNDDDAADFGPDEQPEAPQNDEQPHEFGESNYDNENEAPF